jgi:transcriptional regulator with XRE-family HTH domain
VPRKYLLSKDELAIGRRLLELRRSFKCSRTHLAFLAKVHPSVVKRVEIGRAILKYNLADAFCRHFDVNQAWLAVEFGKRDPYIALANRLESQIPPRMAFSAAFARYIWSEMKDAHKRGMGAGVRVGFLHPLGLPPEKGFEHSFCLEMAAAFKPLPDELQSAFWDALSNAIDRFYEEHNLKRERIGLIRPSNWPKDRPLFDSAIFHKYMRGMVSEEMTVQKMLLTAIDALVIDGGVKSYLKPLLSRLNRLTSEDGTKAELARALGVPLASLSRWLNGKREPGGEMALRLLSWAQQQERKH